MTKTILVTNNSVSKYIKFIVSPSFSAMTAGQARNYLATTTIDPKIIGYLKGKITFTKTNLDILIREFSEETVSNTTENRPKGFNMKETFNEAVTFIKAVGTEVYEYVKANKIFTSLMAIGYGLVFCVVAVPMVLTTVAGVTISVMVMTVISYVYLTLALLAFSTAAILK